MNSERCDAITKAAEVFAPMGRAVFATQQGIHVETIVVSVSQMAGAMLYRNFGFANDVKPGTAVISEQANIAGPQLVNVMLGALKLLGHNVTDASMRGQVVSTKLSQYSLLETQARLDPFVATYCRVAPMTFADAAQALSIATALTIHECRQVLEVHRAAALAVHGIVEGCKAAPLPFGDPARNIGAAPAPH